MPGILNDAVVTGAFGLLKLTVPGPLTELQAMVRMPPTGSPSSVTAPFNLAALGRVMVWAGPALTIGGWFGITCTVKAFASVTTSVLVVSVTLLAPTTAAGPIFNTAVALVAEFTVRDATVIPVPKLAVVVAWTKCVY